MKKSVLLAKVQENRQKHIDMRQEALDGFWTAAEAQIDEVKAAMRQPDTDGQPRSIGITLYPPVDHTPDYTQAVAMLQVTIEDEITLDADDFSCLVNDDWQWTHGWLAANKKFSRSAAAYAAIKGA